MRDKQQKMRDWCNLDGNQKTSLLLWASFIFKNAGLITHQQNGTRVGIVMTFLDSDFVIGLVDLRAACKVRYCGLSITDYRKQGLERKDHCSFPLPAFANESGYTYHHFLYVTYIMQSSCKQTIYLPEHIWHPHHLLKSHWVFQIDRNMQAGGQQTA